MELIAAVALGGLISLLSALVAGVRNERMYDAGYSSGYADGAMDGRVADVPAKAAALRLDQLDAREVRRRVEGRER